LIILLPLIISPSTARADEWRVGGTSFGNLLSATYEMFRSQNQMLFDTMNRSAQSRAIMRQALEGRQGSDLRGQEGPVVEAPKYPISASDFTPSQKQIAPRQLAQAAGPEQRAELESAMEQILNAHEQDAEQNGIRKNNVAYAMALLLGISAQVASGTEVSPDAAEKLVLLVNDGLAASPAYSRLMQSEKQALYETAIILGVMIGAAAQSEETQEPARQLAAQVMTGFGVEASQIPPGSAPVAVTSNAEGMPATVESHGVAAPTIYSGVDNSGFLPGGPGERWLILFPDGVFGWHFPEEGLDGFDREYQMQQTPIKWGEYRVNGTELTFRYLSGETYGASVEANGTRINVPNVAWMARWPALDGLLLEGAYVRHGSPPIVFDANGTFMNYGAIQAIVGVDPYGQTFIHEVPQGEGRYRIRQNTLGLFFSTGVVVRMSIFTHESQSGVGRPDIILLRGFKYTRSQ
jgi:hypothetical protein